MHGATVDLYTPEDGSDMATASVRLDQELIARAIITAKALSRTAPKQIEHWAKIGE
jgi:hypothetical protein